jgi:hypothetical protein
MNDKSVSYSSSNSSFKKYSHIQKEIEIKKIYKKSKGKYKKLKFKSLVFSKDKKE